MATAPHLQMDSSDVEHERVMYMYTFSLHLSIPQKQKKKKKARTHQILESISIYPPSSILLFCFARAVLCYFFFSCFVF